MTLISKIVEILEVAERRRAITLIPMMLVGALFEALGIGMVLPLLTLLSDPTAIYQSPTLLWIYQIGRFETPQGLLAAMGAGLLAVYVLKNLYLTWLYHRQFAFVFRGQVQLARRLFTLYMRQPYAFHLSRNSSVLLRNVNDEVRLLFNNVVIPLLSIIVEGMVVLVIATLLVLIEPIAPLALAVFAIVGATFYQAVRRKVSRLGREQQAHAALMIKWVRQGLGGVKEATVLGREQYFVQRYHQASETYAQAVRFHRLIRELPRFVIETVGICGMLGVVVLMMLTGQPLGQVLPILAVFGMAAVRLMPSTTRIIAALTSVRHFMPALDVIYRDLTGGLERHVKVTHREVPAPYGRFERELRLENVTYIYPGADKPTLDNLSLTVHAGEALAIVGISGAGKTTTVDLMLGLLEPTSGRVLADDKNIHDDLRQWRRRIGYIAQPTYLSDDTVRRNVAFGVPDEEIDDNRIWESLEAAQLAEFVRGLPERLDTVIGERGTRMSGGQRQRIGIARALYHDPEILILDEATSALDNETEEEIIQAVVALRKRKTIITIAHRLSTIRRYDRIVFLKDGRVGDVASFDELIERSADFRRMARTGSM